MQENERVLEHRIVLREEFTKFQDLHELRGVNRLGRIQGGSKTGQQVGCTRSKWKRKVTRVIGRRRLMIGTDGSQRPGAITYKREKITVVNTGRSLSGVHTISRQRAEKNKERRGDK